MWLKACLNGPRPAGSHPCLPITPDELAQEGRKAVASGAVALHFHPRAQNGKETLESSAIAAAIKAVRNACPGIPIEVSTALWIEGDAALRSELVRQWIELPDSAGVNFGEPGAVELAQLLLSKGVGVEAGLFSPSDAQRLVDSGLAPSCSHLQIEPILAGSVAEALATAQAIEQVLNHASLTTPRLLHGKDISAWPMAAYAASQGYATRIGLEDTLLLPGGEVAQDNAELVQTVWLSFANR